MVDRDPPREPAPQLVFFDLDGTISRRDTLIGYVFGFARRRPSRLFGFLRVLPAVLAYALGRSDRGRLKGELLHHVMGGASREELAQWTAEYLPMLRERGLFPDALAAIDAHRRAGDHLVLMSATVDLYVPALAAALGFDDYRCSTVGFQGDRLEGRLISPNLRDEHKALALRELAACFPGRRLMGYGNSSADLPHLRLVDQAVLINPSPGLRKAAQGLPVVFKKWM